MRLGQLSRKLGVSTPEIIQFLASKQITISEDSNAKIEDIHAHWVTEKFAPHLIASVEEVMAEEKKEAESPDEAITVTESATAEISDEAPALPELIKAPKIELAGLKVLGKIEIPEKKKKTEENTEARPEEKDRKPRSERTRPQHEYQERPRKNPVALQREREQREAEQKRKELLAKEKEKKTNHYYNRVKPVVPTKKVRKEEELIEVADIPVEKLPTTLWGKFMRWLNT